MKTRCAFLAALALLSVSAKAQLIMGFSGNDVNTLDLSTHSGEVSLDTSQGELNLDRLNQGWWSDVASNTIFNSNHATGDYLGVNYNSYYIFDLGYLDGAAVTGGALVLNDPAGGNLLLTGPVTLNLYDVSTDVNVLAANTPSPNLAIYDDLGSGVLYGSTSVSGPGGGTITINLDSAAIAAINAAGSNYFAIGASVPPSAVPDGAATGSLLALGLACLALTDTRKRRAVRR